jgi:hypothetical protein
MPSWVFQGNPATFRIDDAVRELEKTTWLVKVNHRKMRMGDVVFLWRSEHNGNPAGVIAKSVMASVVTPMFSPPEVVAYWTDPSMDNTRQDRVELEILNYCTDEKSMIERNDVLGDDVLCEMLVIRQPNGTNFELSDTQAEVLESLWSKNQNEA